VTNAYGWVGIHHGPITASGPILGDLVSSGTPTFPSRVFFCPVNRTWLDAYALGTSAQLVLPF